MYQQQNSIFSRALSDMFRPQNIYVPRLNMKIIIVSAKIIK
jgi:hypothetical protein